MEDVIVEIKKGNKEALEQIIKEHNVSVWTLVHRIIGNLGSKEDIEECVSDVFAQVWSSINKYDSGRGSFRTWILIMTKYKALDYRRKLKNEDRHEVSDEKLYIEQGSVTEAFVVSKENYKEVLKVIDSLKDPDKEIFKRRYFLYEDIDSIANSLNLTKQAIYNRIWRSKEIIKELLKVD